LNFAGVMAMKPSRRTDEVPMSTQHSHSHSEHHGHHHHHGMTQATEPAPLKDPVCGMTVKPTTAHRVMHEGHEVLFCSARCKDKFVANPAQYLKPATPAPVAPQPAKPAAGGAKVEYTCPMHPEIVRDAPGSCPICGMA